MQFGKLFFDLIPLLTAVEIPVVTQGGQQTTATVSSETDLAVVQENVRDQVRSFPPAHTPPATLFQHPLHTPTIRLSNSAVCCG